VRVDNFLGAKLFIPINTACDQHTFSNKLVIKYSLQTKSLQKVRARWKFFCIGNQGLSVSALVSKKQ